jgi:hypothetical protein
MSSQKNALSGAGGVKLHTEKMKRKRRTQSVAFYPHENSDFMVRLQ